jgi:hypothetical protein
MAKVAIGAADSVRRILDKAGVVGGAMTMVWFLISYALADADGRFP